MEGFFVSASAIPSPRVSRQRDFKARPAQPGGLFFFSEVPMATNICTLNTARVTSADITATAGTPVTLFLSAATDETMPPDARAIIEIKSSGGQYSALPQGEMNARQQVVVVDGPCTFRVVKFASGANVGVEQG